MTFFTSYLFVAFIAYLTQKLGAIINAVRSSCLVTIAFILPLSLFKPSWLPPRWQLLIFAASFLGMTSDQKLKPLWIFLASLVLIIFLTSQTVQTSPLGGTLGFCAYLSSLSMAVLKQSFDKSRT